MYPQQTEGFYSTALNNRKKNGNYGAQNLAYLVECLPSMFEALGSVLTLCSAYNFSTKVVEAEGLEV